jgi:SAM-dependent methyltransferase
MLRLAKDEIWVRCTRCRASSVTLSLISVLRSHCSRQLQGSAYEMSARGALFAFLQGHCSSLVGSEFVEGAEPGSVLNGIRCEDVQALNFGDNQFDLVTSTEVFEHVPDDRAGFREVFRVLKNGGCFAFTVPLHDAAETLQRVALGHSGQPVHLLPPEYHEDPANPGKPVLTYRNYGRDITGALKQAGFDEARLVDPQDRIPWGYARRVIVAWKHSKPVAANLAEV